MFCKNHVLLCHRQGHNDGYTNSVYCESCQFILHGEGECEGKYHMNFLFEVWSPDSVAECLEFEDNNWQLYNKLWSFTEGDPLPTECNDNFNERCLGNHWHKLTEKEQEVLNKAANNLNNDRS